MIKKVAEFHKDYEKIFLAERIKNKAHYLKSSKEAMFFIFSYSFYQGRRDELSKKFEEKAKSTLEKLLSENDILSRNSERVTKKELLKSQYRELGALLKQAGVNKQGDRLMVISLVNFIQSNDSKNLLTFFIEQIKSQRISEAYEELDSVWSIGQKVASLILRDIVYIYKLESYVEKKNYFYLQPIDTWVHKLSKEVGLVHREKPYKGEEKVITTKCFDLEVNPIHYNQGAWYIGSNSLYILLKNIDRIV